MRNSYTDQVNLLNATPWIEKLFVLDNVSLAIVYMNISLLFSTCVSGVYRISQDKCCSEKLMRTFILYTIEINDFI